MSPKAKFLVGLAAVVGLGAIYHGPAGAGDRFAAAVEVQAKTAVADTEIAGLSVALQRGPLSRVAVISGEADRFQRDGMGSLPGLNDIVASVPGVSAVRWADEPTRGAMPLLVETLLMLLAGYLLGFGASWLLFGRPKRETYL